MSKKWLKLKLWSRFGISVFLCVNSPASGLNPSREEVVSPSTLSTIPFLIDALDFDGRTLIAKGVDVDDASVAVVFDRHLGGPNRWNPQAILPIPGTARCIGASCCFWN